MHHKSWNKFFDNNPIDLDKFYNNEVNVYPPKELVFKVFEMNVKKIKIIFLGQDTFHGKNQANGLAFSVNKDIKIPPSLRNIFKEIKNNFPDRNYEFEHGDLSRWFKKEKIFLLNTSLTVEEKTPGSHIFYWKNFTDNVIKYICKKNKDCIFLLLGKHAQGKKDLITNNKIIEAPHPSPLARGFIGSEVFIKLEEELGEEINWSN
jgi:uracil-DNA glycosylase